MAILYVAPGGSGSGDWDSPRSLTSALSAATIGDQIWIKQGTITGGFTVGTGVRLYGGFASGLGGTSGSVAGRDLLNDITTIDGNSANIVFDQSTISNAASSHLIEINGMVVANGYIGTGADQIGGGLFMLNGGNVLCENVDFDGNAARFGGSHIGLESASGSCHVELKNVILRNAYKIQYDGVADIQLHGASAATIVCTNVTQNNSTNNEAFLEIGANSSAVLTNCNAYDGSTSPINSGSGTWAVTYTNIRGGYTGTGNINTTPNFINSPTDLRPHPATSKLIDAGNGTTAPTTDIYGRSREDVGTVTNTGTGSPAYTDIGAEEYNASQISALAAGTSTVTGTVTGLGAVAGTSAGAATVTGVVIGIGAIAGVISGVATVTGTLTDAGAGNNIAGTAAGSSTVTGTVTGLGVVAGASAGAATVTGTVTGLGAAAGTAAGSATVTGTITGLGAVAAVAAGVATVTGTLTGTGAVAGTSTGTATVTGTLSALGGVAGTSAGVAVVTGTLTGLGAIAGTVSGVATVTGTISNGTPSNIAGTAAGTSTVTGTVTGLGAIAGTSAGSATVSGRIINATFAALGRAVTDAVIAVDHKPGQLVMGSADPVNRMTVDHKPGREVLD